MKVLFATLTMIGLAVQGFGRPARPPLFKASAVSASAPSVPDTLEVFCIYVQFQDETVINDEATTTGRGVFGSDPDNKYTLDPNGQLRSYEFYLDKHFEFAKNYFEKVSNGRVTVTSRIFPQPDAKGRVTPITLDRRMKFYNPSELDKGAKEKTSDFNQERGQALMTFVRESIDKADAKDSVDNPFKVASAEAKNPKKHTCYLLFHAGHSRLLDGGQLGSFGANTPNDFTDFFVTKDDFKILAKATLDGRTTGKPDSLKMRDSLGVKVSGGDTISEIMMLSESATQDKVNWGINGILINQLARKMGMPDMFDVVQGISQLGFFDLMDFAGYNTLNGFLPVYPSAWVRAYMGWEDPVTARPGAGPSKDYSEYQVWSPTARPDAAHATTVKVPLNEREYLLVENRQRAAGDTQLTIRFSKQKDASDLAFSDTGSVTVPFNAIDSIFLDSLCDTKGKNCKVNKYKPAGVITGASSYDLGLPSSGLLVWHVNEWFISQFLKFGAVNAYLGDTLRSQYKGVELVEADGSPSVGKEFKDQLGQSVFDYGSGSDMLPHLRRQRKDPPKDTSWLPVDTLDQIGPYGMANTNAWNDGRTHIRLESPIPSKALLEPGVSSFSGDSIFNVRDSALTLRVYWPSSQTVAQPSGSTWPAQLDPGRNAESVNLLKSAAGGKVVVALSDRGYAQALTPAGAAAVAAIDTLHPKPGYDSVTTLLPSGKTKDTTPIPVNSLAGVLGKPIGSATLGDTVMAVLTADKITFTKLRDAGLAAKSKDSSAVNVSVTLPSGATPKAAASPKASAARGATASSAATSSPGAGPMAAGDRFWIITSDKRALAFSPDGAPIDSIALPDFAYQSLAALPSAAGAAGKPMNLIAAARGGKAVVIDVAAHQAIALDGLWNKQEPDADEDFTVATADFDRDGIVDAFLLGSRGAATLVGLKSAPTAAVFPGFPQRFQRSVRFADTVYHYTSSDPSAPALADLDGDGHPDILFTGSNCVFAIDYHGAFLKGWPFLLQAHQNVGFLYGSSLHPETVVQTTPLVLALDGHPAVLIGSPDGLIYAVDSLGQKLKATSFDAAQQRYAGLQATDVSDWPLTMGGMNLDSNVNPFIHLTAADLDGDGTLELLAQSGSGGLNAWTLKKSAATASLGWTMAGGNAGRQNFLDVSAWQAAGTAALQETIEEFYLFPSPLRGPTATVHLKLGAPAQKARIRMYDLAGNVVKDQEWQNLTQGLQAYNQILDLHLLGADVYTALVEVWFDGGKKKKWERLGVIR